MRKCQSKLVLTGVLLSFFLNWSCTKIDTTQLGEGLIPVVDNIHTFDTTLDVLAMNFDSVSSECEAVNVNDLHALGIIENDPMFGKSSASISVELKPASYPFSIPDTLAFDSAVLVLHYSHSFGDSLQAQRVQVFPLTNSFKYDSTYTSCDILDFQSSTLIGERIYKPIDLDDSVHSVNENATNQLRIPMDKAFIQALLADTAAFRSDSAFKEHFKGFAINADQAFGGNALNYISLTDADTRLAMYFSPNTANKDTVVVYNLVLSQFCGHANSIERERGSSEITNNLGQPTSGNEFIYIQTSPGSYAELGIPGLSGLSNRVIHRAELIVQQAYSSDPSNNYFAGPQTLFLDTKDTSTTGQYIPIPCDFSLVSQTPNFTYLGGIKSAYTNGQGQSLSQYIFNISRYVQTIVTKSDNNAVLRLRAPYVIVNPRSYLDRCNQLISYFNFTTNNVADGRVKLHGTSGSPNRTRLHIVYSVL
ncbi:MAG: DUF4270 family protein [Ginsengibacter sp.]